MGRIEEFLLIFVVGLLLFGPNKLKDIASSLGGALNEFKKAMNPEGTGISTNPPQAAAQPIYIQAAKASARRRKSTVTRKKVKASR